MVVGNYIWRPGGCVVAIFFFFQLSLMTANAENKKRLETTKNKNKNSGCGAVALQPSQVTFSINVSIQMVSQNNKQKQDGQKLFDFIAEMSLSQNIIEKLFFIFYYSRKFIIIVGNYFYMSVAVEMNKIFSTHQILLPIQSCEQKFADISFSYMNGEHYFDNIWLIKYIVKCFSCVMKVWAT